MKKAFISLAFAILLTGCAFSGNQNSDDNSKLTASNVSEISKDNNNSTNNEPAFNVDLDKLKEQYGEFKITTEKGVEGVLSSDGTIYTIKVSASKSAFSITGYFAGQIIITNEDNFISFKGVEITLNNACLVSNSGPNIDYTANDKNVEIVAKKSTENYIINTGNGSNDYAVHSEKNIEVNGKGTLNILTKTAHGLKAEKKIRFYDAFTLNITSGHDAIHASSFISNNEEELAADFEEFTGTMNVLSAVSQAIDCSTNSAIGTIELTSGTYNFSNCESAFKTDISLTIGCVVVATNLSSDPVVKGDNSTGVTIEITNSGSFTIDGVSYTETNI